MWFPTKRTWQDDSVKSLQQPHKASDGKRYIVIHAGEDSLLKAAAAFEYQQILRLPRI